MIELNKIKDRPEHNANYIYPNGDGKTLELYGCFTREQLLELACAMEGHGADQLRGEIQLDGTFTKEQLLKLIHVMETPDGDPVVYTEKMAAQDDELLANVPVPTEPWRDFMFTLQGSNKVVTASRCAKVKKLTRRTIDKISDLASNDHGEKMIVVGIYELDILDES